jgi:lysine-N-methylase
VLGVFCEQLSKVGKDNHKIVALMNEAARLVESRAMVDALAGLKPNHRGQAIVFATLWSGKEAPGSTARQRAVIATVASKLGTDAETGVASTDKLVAAYTLGVQRLPEALAATPHLLDHFILNEMFLHMFPFDAADAYESYLQLVSRFGLLRLMLAAQCVPEGPLPGVDALVETVQAFCRRFRHDPNFARRANEALRNEGWDSLDNLYGFLRH